MELAALAVLAAEAYVYGYPLVRDLSVVEDFMHTGLGPLPPTPFNHFAHAGRPSSRMPCMSADDTVRAVVHLDLSGGPVLLRLPRTDDTDGAAGAYCVFQFVDAWTNNFAYVGRRAGGARAGDWLVAPPGWAGRVPDGVLGVVDAPTSVVSVIGRGNCDGSDGPEVRGRGGALQDQLGVTYVEPGTHRTGLPAPDPDVPTALWFFEQLRVWMADFPPSAPDQAYQDRFQPLGLLEEGPSPYTRAGPDLVRALTEGLARGRAWVEEAHRAAAAREGWVMDPHLFDYNLDHHGVGTIDSAQWRIADREASYRTRAVAARGSLWGVHGYEAVYAHALGDAAGERLNGAHSYVLCFGGRPPVGAGWSLAVYDTAGQRVGKPLTGRGSVYGQDGSLTIRIGRERPHGADAAESADANGMSAPDGDFRLVLRLCEPGAAILDGTYAMPAVERTR